MNHLHTHTHTIREPPPPRRSTPGSGPFMTAGQLRADPSRLLSACIPELTDSGVPKHGESGAFLSPGCSKWRSRHLRVPPKDQRNADLRSAFNRRHADRCGRVGGGGGGGGWGGPISYTNENVGRWVTLHERMSDSTVEEEEFV